MGLLVERELIAPRFLLIEFSHVLSKMVRRGTLKAADALDCCADLPLPAALSFPVPDDALVKPELELSMRHQHAVYDCLHVALAVRKNAYLVTADRELAERFAGLADIRPL